MYLYITGEIRLGDGGLCSLVGGKIMRINEQVKGEYVKKQPWDQYMTMRFTNT